MRKRKWVRIGEGRAGAGPATWSCFCLKLAHRRVRLYASVHAFPGSPQQKQIQTPRQSQSISSVRMKEGLERPGSTAHNKLTRNLLRKTSSRKLQANRPTKSMGLTLQSQIQHRQSLEHESQHNQISQTAGMKHPLSDVGKIQSVFTTFIMYWAICWDVSFHLILTWCRRSNWASWLKLRS